MADGCAAMRKRYGLRTLGACSAIAVAALTLWAGASFSGDPRSERAAWQEKYRRPAEIPFPEGNGYTEAKFKLGQTLFFDPILSGSKTRACATCHNPGLSWGDGLPKAIGEKQVALPLRTPTILNVAWGEQLGWDGHFRNLEAVAFGPITGPKNMNMPESQLMQRLSAIPGCRGNSLIFRRPSRRSEAPGTPPFTDRQRR